MHNLVNGIEVPLSEQEIVEFKEREEAFKKQAEHYLNKRQYPSIEVQLDMLYWDKINNTNVWEETISQIKERFPK